MVASIVAGCGGGGDDDATASSITKAQFIKQADTVCEETLKRAQAAYQSYLSEASQTNDLGENLSEEEQAAALIAAVLTPNSEQETEELRDLGSPAGDEDEVEALISAREEYLEIAQAEPGYFGRKSSAVASKSEKLAREYGLEACSRL